MDPAALSDEVESRRLTVFYHSGCPDGVAGAWAIYEALPLSVRSQLGALGGSLGPSGRAAIPPLDQLARGGTVFHGLAHADALPSALLTKARHVVYVDISPPGAHAGDLAAAAATLTVLDHHRGARAAIETLRAAAAANDTPLTVVFTEELAGAQIAWDWAHPGPPGLSEPRPAVVEYVADRDLWAWRLEDSRAINKALYVEGHVLGIGALASLRRLCPSPGALPEGLAARGAAYLVYESALLGRLASGAYRATVAALLPGEETAREYCVLVVNSPELRSELGEALMEKAGPEVHFAVIWSLAKPRDEIWASARTTRPDVDLSVIVPCLVGGKGGGGHPRAAGFAIAGDSLGAAVRRWQAPPPGEP